MKGIIFNSAEVNTILAGNKSQIRSVIKVQPSNDLTHFGKCPFGEIGDLVFVKESFWQFGGYDSGIDCDEPRFIGRDKITFCQEEAAKPQTLNKAWKKRPAQYMKQHQSRITLRIKDISVERLQEISEGGVRDEGFDILKIHPFESCFTQFKEHWNATHKKPEEKWEANPWIWKIEFEVVK